MKYLLLLLLAGCGLTKDLGSMKDKMSGVSQSLTNIGSDMDSMSASLKGTLKGIHAQTLMAALQQLLSPENTRYVNPSSTTPTSMMPMAQAFANEAEPNDVVAIATLWMAEINQSQPDVLTKESKRQCDHDKWVKLTALQLIAALMPQSKIDDMIKTEMDGQYLGGVYDVLTLRYFFISSFLLDNQVLSAPLVTTGSYESAIVFIKAVSFVENLPFKDNLKVKIFGFFDQEKLGLNQVVTLNKDKLSQGYWKKLKDKFDKELDKKYAGTPEYEKIKKEIEDGLK